MRGGHNSKRLFLTQNAPFALASLSQKGGEVVCFSVKLKNEPHSPFSRERSERETLKNGFSYADPSDN